MYHCLACGDKGWLVANNSDHGVRIERCDSCKYYKNDAEAIQAVDLMASAWLRENGTRPFDRRDVKRAYSP